MFTLAPAPIETVEVVAHLAVVDEYTPQEVITAIEAASPSDPPLQDIFVESIIETPTLGI